MILNIVSLLLKILEGHRIVTETKKKGILFYLRFLRGVRLGSLGILSFIFLFQMFFFSFIGLIASALYLSPIDFETKVWIVFGCCLTVFLVMTSVLIYVFSQKTWLKLSGVNLNSDFKKS